MDHITTVFFQTRDILHALWSHVATKAIISFFLATGSLLFGKENYQAILLLGILIIIDLLTGMIAAVSKGEPLQSRKVFKSATKAVVYLMFFSAAYLTHQIVPYSEFIKTGVLSFLAITELLSVMENLAKMGYSLPAKLLNQIRERRDGETKNGG